MAGFITTLRGQALCMLSTNQSWSAASADSQEGREGLAAFLTKRQPDYQAAVAAPLMQGGAV
jgi:hypothetical protein